MKALEVKLLFENDFLHLGCVEKKHGWIKFMGIKTKEYPTDEQKAEYKKRCKVIAENFDADRLFQPMVMKLILIHGYTMMMYIDTPKPKEQLKEQFGWDFYNEGDVPDKFWKE